MKNRLISLLSIVFVLFFVLLGIAQTKICYHSISTLILIVVMIVLLFIHFWVTKKKKKMFLSLFGYGIFVFGYFIVTYYYNQDFHSLVPGNFSYNGMKEMLYFLKMSMPFMMLYVFSRLELSTTFYHKVIKWTSLMISLIIIVTNLFCLSYGSYSDTFIQGNFFSWFTDGYEKYTFYHLASKGLFESANQIGALLLMFLPVFFYDLYQKSNIKNFLLLLLNLLAMAMLGTKTSVFGFILVTIMMIFLGCFFLFVKKEVKFDRRNLLYFSFIIFLFAILFPFTPIQNRKEVQNNINQEDSVTYLGLQDLKTSLGEEKEVIDKVKYIEEHYEAKRIYDHFILNSYPYRYDPDFWYDILELPISLRTDYRFLEESMVKRVVEINNNPLDKWFGISYTRVQNIFNIERDFVMQYYSVGILGTILFLISYFIYLLKMGYLVLKNKLNDCFLSITLLCGACIFLAVSYYSGNLLNSFMVTPYLCLIMGYANRKLSGGELEYEKENYYK